MNPHNFVKASAFICATGLAVGAGQSADAAYIGVDDFDSYTSGSVNGGSTAFVGAGGPWSPWDGTNVLGGTGLVSITSGADKALAHGWTSGRRGAYRAVNPIANTDTGTFYFQILTTDATPNVSYGLSDIAAPTNNFSAFEAQVALVDDGNSGNGLFKLIARDGGGFVDLATGLSTGNWYDIWMAIDNTTDTYDVYFGTSGDPDVVGSKVGTGLSFRNGTSASLGTFVTISSSHGNNAARLDDIQFNSNFIPEPTSLVVGAIGLGGLIARRRRRA